MSMLLLGLDLDASSFATGPPLTLSTEERGEKERREKLRAGRHYAECEGSLQTT